MMTTTNGYLVQKLAEPPNEQFYTPAASHPSERARAREIASYLQAASISRDTTRLVTEEPIVPPARSSDPNLTALVQLGALRLDCERSFFSLIDGATQYIVAEATKTTSLTDDGGTSEKDLFLGTMLLDKNWGVCPRTVDFFTDDEGTMTCDDPNVVANRTRYIIKDMLADEQLSQRPYVKSWPYMRSYAEVPIISPLGYVIGGYCVVDSRLRDFDEKAIKILTEVGGTIVSHLEHVRMRHHQSRSEKLIRGLDLFIQEEASLQASRKNSTTREKQPNIIEEAKSRMSMSLTASGNLPEEEGTSLDLSKRHLSLEDQKEHLAATMHHPEAPETNTSPTATKESTLPAELRRAFARSATLIRESLQMDGLVFLDASPLSFSSRSKYLDLEEADLSLEADLPNSVTSNLTCPVMASSFAKKLNTVHVQEAISFTEQLLYRIIRRFPRGQLFSADEHGSFDKFDPGASNGPFRPALISSNNSAREDVDELFKLIPDSRSIVFLPLWHFQKERWFAAAIGWTCDPAHSFLPSDATYLSAFGNSIMAEVLRYEALAVSKAKSDFISSISHEIRSPLHGILATTELLGEIVKSNEEKSMLSMIKSCGTTLLDTLNHLLEFAKINNLGQARNNFAEQRSAFLDVVDLSELVEDVTESVAAGHAFDTNLHKQPPQQSTSPAELSGTPASINLPVLVTLNMQPFDGWNMPLDSGAWKRIVMNLVGNSLKYTHKGRIQIRLSIKEQGDQRSICFVVEDTGIGMSEEYLKYRLFTPFAQENTFSSGTGLGLCIVHQIVQDLGGKLDVCSEQGVGTCISALVPFTETLQPVLARQPHPLQGRTLCYVQPAAGTIAQLEEAGTGWSHLEHVNTIRDSITGIAAQWLNMKVLYTSNLADMSADVYVVDKTLDFTTETINLSTLVAKPVIIIGSPRSNHRTPLLRTLRAPVGPRQLGTVISDVVGYTAYRGTNSESSISATESSKTISTINSTEPIPVEERSSVLPIRTPLNHLPLSTMVSEPVSLPHQHVLAVEDNAINLKILTKLLDQLKCTYATATNGLEAVIVFKSTPQPFSLIFMDINMPVMDGFESTQQIRAYEREEGKTHKQLTRIVALTGLGNASSQKEAFTSGMDLFLTKPVSLAKLKAMLFLPMEGEVESP